MSIIPSLKLSALQQYGVITANYWSFTLTDGALRMLVVLYFHQLGYGALDIALLFLFYEFFGVVTNLVGGWLGARIGLNNTMNIGIALQLIALTMLFAPTHWLNIPWVMAAQALSGIAKDLNKMSAKSAIKQLVPHKAQGKLFKWVAILTGSKNALKGLGFFIGALLLSLWGFSGAIVAMIILLAGTLFSSLLLLNKNLGQSQQKAKFTQLLSKSPAINALSLSRLFLFASRDVWFVVALPVFLSHYWSWSPAMVGCFFAAWVIAYGFIQTLTPTIIRKRLPDGKLGAQWAFALAVIPAALTLLISQASANDALFSVVFILGLFVFGAVFAVNSSMHSYLIVRLATHDGTSLDVGFYYMANAAGRLLGTVLSGAVFQWWGLEACLWVSSGFVLIAAFAAGTVKTQ